MLSLPLFLLVPAYLATASPIVGQGQAPEAINVNAAVVPLDHPVYHRFSTRAGKRKIFDAAAAKKEREDVQRKHGTHLRKRAMAERQKEKATNNDAAAQRGKNGTKDDSSQKGKVGNDAQKGKDDTKKKAQDDAKKKAQDDATKKGKDDYSSNANAQKGKDDPKKKAQDDAAKKAQDEAAKKAQDDARKKAQDDTTKKGKDDTTKKGKDDYSSNANAQKGKDDAKKTGQDDATKKGKDDWATNANNQKGKADAQKGKDDPKKGKDDYSSNANAQKGKNDSQKGKEDAMNNAHKGQNDMKSDAQKGKNGNDREPVQDGKGPHKTGSNAQKGQNEQGPYRASKSPITYAYGTPGTHHPVDLLDIGDLRRRGQLKKRQGVNATDPLTNHQGKDFVYYGPLSIGTPGQQTTVLFDTGSSDLILPLSICTTCSDGPFFDTNQSSTFFDTHRYFEIQYLDGSASRGTIATDTVTVAGLVVANQSFGAIVTESNDQGLPSAGIMGMGFPANAQTRATPFFWNLAHGSALTSNIFSFYLSRDTETGSELCFGCVDSTKFTGELNWYSLDANVTNGTNYWWNIPSGGVSVGGSQPSTGLEAIIDSGTSLIYVPPVVAAELYQTLPGSTEDILDLGQGYYTFPCENHVLLPPISFVFGGVTYEVNKEDFNLGAMDIFNERCVGGIVGLDIGLHVPAAILGVEFMKQWYSVFDLDGLRVGFAPAVAPSTAVGV